MGLNTTHGCWDGGYSSFNSFREALAEASGFDLSLMEGFTNNDDGIPWSTMPHSPLHLFLNHSDCEGTLHWQDCEAIANDMEALIPKLPQGAGVDFSEDCTEKTLAFIKGLRLAAANKEDVVFQ